MGEPMTNPNNSEPSPAKTFTQEEVDTMIGKRLAKAMKGVPSEEELAAYRTWKEGQQTEQQRQAQRDKEFNKAQSDLAAARSELTELKREKYVLSKGLTGDEAEFISFKASRLVNEKTTFEQAVDQLTEGMKRPTFDWTASLGGSAGGTKNENAVMNDLIRSAFK